MNETLRQRYIAFAEKYVETLNGAEAYRYVYGDKLAKSTVETNSSRLLKNTFVKDHIRKLLDERCDQRVATIQDLLEFHTDVVNNEFKKLGYNKPLYLKDRQASAMELMRRLELDESKNIDNSIKIKIVKASEVDE
nr:MAG TPA: Terminase small subunit [Caudoviricetes sp.]